MHSTLFGMNQEPFVEEIEAYTQTILETVPEPLLILDTNTRIRSANRAFYLTFQISPGETRNRLLCELGNGRWDIPQLRTVLLDFVLGSLEFNDFELEHTFPVIGRRVILVNARKLQAGHQREGLVLAMKDVTQLRRAETDLKAANAY